MELQPGLDKIYKFLMDVSPDTNPDSVLLILLSKLSQIAMLHRVKVDSYHYSQPTPVNIYAMNFIPSGEGKDRIVSEINTLLFKSYFARKAELEAEYIRLAQEGLEEEAEIRSDLKTPLRKAQWIQQNLPRSLVDIFQDATIEGFLSVRAEFEKAQFGGTLVTISEFSDYILNENPGREQFLSVIKDVYEEGNSLAKVIKSEKTVKGVSGVPNSVLFQSSPDGILEGNGANKAMSFLNRGHARRALLCISTETNSTAETLSYEEYRAKRLRIKEESPEVEKIVMRAVNVSLNPGNQIFKFTDDADRALYDYMSQMKVYTHKVEAIQAEAKSRPRKAAKIAGLVAFIEHPTVREVTLDDLETAISIVEHYSAYLTKFAAIISEDKVVTLYNHFKNNLNIPYTTTQVRQLNIVGWNIFARWFTEAIPEIESMAITDGYEFKQMELGRRGTSYVLTEIKKTDTNKIKLSVSDDITEGYKVREMPFNQIHEVITSPTNYSASEFREGYRDKEHWVDGNNVVILDIDGGWSMLEAGQFLRQEGLKAFLCTTKSHMKQKDKKPPCERFRLVLPTYSPFKGTSEEWSYMMGEIFKYFGNRPDKAARDVSRFYYGHPGEYKYIDGKPLMLEMFDRRPKKTRVISKQVTTDGSRIKEWFRKNAVPGERNNTLNKARLFAIDEGIDPEVFVREINSQLLDPLDEAELRVLLRKK